MLSFYSNYRHHITYFVCLRFFFHPFKVYCKGTENNYTFDFGPSEPGARLIDEAS